MISGEKILVSGASGLVGLQLAGFLAQENEVWGLARYSTGEERGLNTYAGAALDAARSVFGEYMNRFGIEAETWNQPGGPKAC